MTTAMLNIMHYHYGGTFGEWLSKTPQPYKFGGKELDRKNRLDWGDFGARMLDSSNPSWGSIDPMAEKYYSISPYTYCAANPIRYIDPTGMDIYRFDNKTGKMILYKHNDDNFDQIGKFKQNKNSGEYILRTNKRGEAKTLIDNIEKGILSDGINFKDNNNKIAVGDEGQANVGGVEAFAVNLSDMVGKEIGGAYFSKDATTATTHISFGRYVNNKLDETIGHGQNLGNNFLQ